MRRAFDDLPPVRGALKIVPEDFVVEEIAEAPPDGDGPHLLLWVEKQGRDTREVVEALSSRLRIPSAEIGVAGQKDRQAVSRQWISVPGHAIADPSEEARLPSGDGWRVLSARRHGSKLRTGRLAGNSFRIRLRGGAEDVDSARTGLERLAARGVPNFFGTQRFGRRHDNAERGRAIVRGESGERRRFKTRMYLSALQSELFNEWLDRRFDDGLLERAVKGDLLRDRTSSSTPYLGDDALRLCREPESESFALASGTADPMGPIFGARMRPAEDEAQERETAVLLAAGLCFEDFLDVERDAPGSRRPARAWLESGLVSCEEDDLILCFDLERGAYATVVLSHLGLAV